MANKTDNAKNRKSGVSILVLAISILFILLCFLSPEFIFAYPFIVIVLTLISFEYGLQFIFFTLGINYALFQNNLIFGTLHPNSFITIGQILFLAIGLVKMRKVRLEPHLKVFMVFAVVSLISIIYSLDAVNGIKVFANILLYALALLLFINVKNVSLEHIFRLIIISSLIACVVVYPLQAFGLHRSLFMSDPDRGLRFYGGEVHPVPLSFYFLLVFYSALYLYDNSKDKSRRKGYLPVCAVALAIIVLTQTRMALIGLFLTLLLYFHKKNRLKYVLPVAAIFLLLYSSFLTDFFLKKGAEYYQPGIVFVSGGRIDFWKTSLDSFSKNPVLGTGLGSSAILLEDLGVITPHSDFVRVLVELGLVGTVFFLCYLYLQGKNLLKDVDSNIIPICLFAFFIICMFTDSMIDYNLYFTLPLFILLGIASRRDAPKEGSNPDQNREQTGQGNKTRHKV